MTALATLTYRPRNASSSFLPLSLAAATPVAVIALATVVISPDRLSAWAFSLALCSMSRIVTPWVAVMRRAEVGGVG